MAESFKVELVAMQTLLTRQATSLNTNQFQSLAALQAGAFARRASELIDLDTSIVDDLTVTIQSGPWPTQCQTELILGLANALAGNPMRGEKREKRPGQVLMHFRNLTSKSEKQKLESKDVAFTDKLSLALDILARLCAVLLTEKSKRNVLATVAAVHPKPEGWHVHELREWYTSFKTDYHARFKDSRADPSIGHIKQFPETPAGLGDIKCAIMFEGDAQAPLDVDSELLCAIENNIWCRGDATALRPQTDKVTRLKQPASTPSASSSPGDMSNPMQAMCMMMMNMMQQNNQQNMQQEEPRIELSRPSSRVRGRSASLGSMEGFKAIEDTQQDAQTPERPKLADAPAPTTETKKVLSPQDQADRFLAALQGKTPDDDDDDDDDDDAADPTKLKTNGKTGKGNPKKASAKDNAKTKAKEKASAKGKAKAKASATGVKTDSKAKTLIFNPMIALEATRSQYLFRPGLTVAESGESSKAFTFANHFGKAGAKKAADKWLKDFKSSHKCK